MEDCVAEPVANLMAELHPIFLVGPTGVGKSDLGLALARQRNAAILCLDSMQVYRGLDIGTGKPTIEERREILHGGLDLVEPGEKFDVGLYLQAAAAFLEQCRSRQQPVIIVGGTGLYFRALTQGFCPAPSPAPELRQELEGLSLSELRDRLKRCDPEMVELIDMKNPRRVSRAIEVKESTGRSLREWQQENEAPLVERFQAYLITRERDDLRERIARRVGQMLEQGWLEEAGKLTAKHGKEAIQRCAAIGYPELIEVCEGADLAEAREKIVNATRQYAKRQLTWFRRETTVIELRIGLHSQSIDLLNRIPSGLPS